MFLSEIGETYNRSDTNVHPRILLTSPTSLQCITDKIPCCFSWWREGRWYFQDGKEVHIYVAQENLYRDRADDGSVNLNRRNDAVMSPVGLYCCELSNAQQIYHTLCANIGM